MRIIAGKLRGLKLNTFEYDNIRPSLDSVRESIFNKIQFGINGATFLDLFAGTGVFSIEAYSRGAEAVYTVDCNKNSIKLIESNIKKARIDSGIKVVNQDYKEALISFRDRGISFDYIFIDPPFNTTFGNDAIRLIMEYGVLSKDGLIIYEHSIDSSVDSIDNIEITAEKKYGTILVSYIKEVHND